MLARSSFATPLVPGTALMTERNSRFTLAEEPNTRATSGSSTTATVGLPDANRFFRPLA